MEKDIKKEVKENRMTGTNDRRNDRSLNLKEILDSHKQWLNGQGGSRADFTEADLRDADFRKADLRNACFSSLVPIHKDYVSSKESSLIALLMRLSYKTMHLYTMSREERNHCTEVILLYYRLHIPGFPELKSLDVLKSLFA